MPKQIDPSLTNRKTAFEMWMKAPMPMLTLLKTLDVTNIVKAVRRSGYKFNMLMCWCIGRAACGMKEFYLLPVGEKLLKYDKIAVNTIVKTADGNINTCDIPFSKDLKKFNRDYLRLTGRVHIKCEAYDLSSEYMVIGTSAISGYAIDGAVNIYAGFYNNPFLIWGKYRKKLFKTELPVSFQFHHTQMDGMEAAEFLERLQREIKNLKIKK